jgi:hypothetical protein
MGYNKRRVIKYAARLKMILAMLNAVEVDYGDYH